MISNFFEPPGSEQKLNGLPSMTDSSSLALAVGALFKQYRKKLVNPATGKAWTLQELSEEMTVLIRTHLEEGSEEGLSPSAISRLENGSLLPSRPKLKILADFLQIPAAELKPLINLGDSRTAIPDQKERIRVREMENKQHKTPLDWLRLISYANMASDYHHALEMAEDALLVLDSPGVQWPYPAVLRALIQSKKAYAQFWLDNKEAHLARSREWAEHAQQGLPEESAGGDSWEFTLLQIETIRSLTTASLELFNYHYILHPNYSSEAYQQLQTDYRSLDTLFAHFDARIKLDQAVVNSEQYQLLLELYLYFRREKDRLVFKWLEVMEMQALWQTLSPRLQLTGSPRLEEVTLAVYEQLLQTPERALALMDGLYQPVNGQLVFTPAPALQEQWQSLHHTILQTLAMHEHLADPNPNKAYQEAVLLYPVTSVRLGRFDQLVDLAYFQLIYMQTTSQTRATWYYIRACCYALAYRTSQQYTDLERSLANWQQYVHGSLDSQEFNSERFAGLLTEAALWSTWLPLVTDQKMQQQSPLVAWFVTTLENVMKQPRYQRLRRKA
jgi:transcriptional regulator with XRE-family HTH domain